MQEISRQHVKAPLERAAPAAGNKGWTPDPSCFRLRTLDLQFTARVHLTETRTTTRLRTASHTDSTIHISLYQPDGLAIHE